MAKRKPSYDDKFRRDAVLLLEAAGYPDKKGSLVEVERRTGVPSMTLSRWFKGTNNPPPNNIVTEKRPSIIDHINNELNAIFKEMPNARDQASYRDLAVATGILVEKKQLLEGKATEIVNVNNLTNEERADRAMGLFESARTRRDQQALIQ